MHSSFSQMIFMLIIGEDSVNQEQIGIKFKMDVCKDRFLELPKNAPNLAMCVLLIHSFTGLVNIYWMCTMCQSFLVPTVW